MALGSVALAFITVAIDRSLDPDAFKMSGVLAPNSVEGTRTILSIVTGSMISIAGVTFSLTMVAVTNAAAQYGPRLIGNFMRDKANQFTLGVFTSTFIYGLLILRVAHVGDPTSSGENPTEFIPNVSVFFAMMMTLLSVGVLIYFVHHIPETLNVGNITARIGRDLRDRLRVLVTPEDKRRPRLGNDGAIYDVDLALRVPAKEEGYVQTLNFAYLVKVATEHDLIIDLQFQPGDFVVCGDVLLDAWKVDGTKIETDEEGTLIDSIRNAYAMGQSRTVHQNLLYLADELVEVLARALSPGVNDPYTATNCIHWYQSALNVMVAEPDPIADRFDEQNIRRVMTRPLTFETMLDVFAGKSRPYVASDKIAAAEMLSMLGKLRARATSESRKTALANEMSALVRAAYDALPNEVDRESIADLANKITSGLKDDVSLEKSRREEGWLGGTA